MASFTGSAGADTFLGTNVVVDTFFFDPLHLSQADTVNGGGGAVVDVLEFTAGGQVKAAAFHNVSGIEAIRLDVFGNNVTLTDALASSARGARLSVFGDSGNDVINAAAFAAGRSLFANAGFGNDKVNGGNGDDTLNGEGGNDILTGKGGADTMNGGEGDDRVTAQGADTLIGGGHSDVLRFANSTIFAAAVKIDGNDNQLD